MSAPLSQPLSAPVPQPLAGVLSEPVHAPLAGAHAVRLNTSARPTSTLTLSDPSLSLATFVQPFFGIPVTISLRGYALARKAVTAAVEDAYAALHHFDSVFSPGKPDSDVSRLARGAVTIDDCDPLVAEAVDLALDAASLTGGSFTGFLPDDTGELHFDPSGLVKGWAVDVAAEALASVAGISICINADGDVLVGGSPAWGPWSVDLEDPSIPGSVVHSLSLDHGAAATSVSGLGRRIFDPRAGCRRHQAASATVIAPSLRWADIWATALLVGGSDAARRLARWNPEVDSYLL